MSSFDWYEDYIDEDEATGDRANAWLKELTALFLASPEAQSVPEDQREPLWLHSVWQYAASLFQVPLSQLDPDQLEEILLETFPSKVSTEASEAFKVTAQLQAFFRFAARAFGASEVQPLLELLTPELTEEMHQRMADPSYYGMAKSLVMQAIEAGYDVSTQEGMEQAMAAYNLSMLGLGPTVEDRLKEARLRARQRKKEQKKSRKRR